MEHPVRLDVNLCRSQASLKVLSDVLKGSYYANPISDNASVSEEEREAYPEYYGSNICTCNASCHVSPSIRVITSNRACRKREGSGRFRGCFQGIGEVCIYFCPAHAMLISLQIYIQGWLRTSDCLSAFRCVKL